MLTRVVSSNMMAGVARASSDLVDGEDVVVVIGDAACSPGEWRSR